VRKAAETRKHLVVPKEAEGNTQESGGKNLEKPRIPTAGAAFVRQQLEREAKFHRQATAKRDEVMATEGL
jgi:hypothetical protein